MQRTLGSVLVALIVGCSGGQKMEEPVEPPTDKPAEPTEPAMERKMLGHWVEATKVRDDVIAGNLEAAKVSAAGLEKEVEAPPMAWTTYVTEMKLHVATLEDATSLDDAAKATAAIGATCGSCHADTGASVQMMNSEPPPVGDDPATHMHRHKWAVDAMWEGLVGPSDGRWVDGLGVLAEKPLHGREEPSGHVTKDKLDLLGEKVHDLGVLGTGVPRAERAEIFSELIATCADCHAQTGTAVE